MIEDLTGQVHRFNQETKNVESRGLCLTYPSVLIAESMKK